MVRVLKFNKMIEGMSMKLWQLLGIVVIAHKSL